MLDYWRLPRKGIDCCEDNPVREQCTKCAPTQQDVQVPPIIDDARKIKKPFGSHSSSLPPQGRHQKNSGHGQKRLREREDGPSQDQRANEPE